ncbi:hypothetical protein MTR67_052132 [Solanum verrucosum]|uniref:Uncharacterized protein n=1 Tax=Solanum verrucosum TaxID=315347 RepID=A0AAF0V5N3_SOLVR|nr:hypothetical protein MTR67_052132 [Solanum verrucosum]
MGVSHSEYSMSNDEPTQTISEDIPGFEVLFSKPPDQILKTIRRVSSTSSTPPLKKDRKLIWPNQKVLQWNNKNESFSIPDFAGNVFDLHSPSSDSKEKKKNPDIKVVKQYLKEYVSDSHNYY